VEIIRGLVNLKPRHRGCVVTIGNFDGVHLGHQAILKQVTQKARELDVHAMLICFEPQPQEFFDEFNAPARLTRFREKVELLEELEIKTRGNLTDEEDVFLTDILVDLKKVFEKKLTEQAKG